MAQDRIRLGIIGCGSIARGRHLGGMATLKRYGLDNFEITALCDTVEDNLAVASEIVREQQEARPRTYRDWQDLIARAPVDAVDICLPHGLHHVVGISALGAGLHALVEKPYTVTLKTGRALAEAADRSGKVLAVGVPHRRMPGQRAVQWALNDAGLVGEVRTFFANYTQYRPVRPPAELSPAMRWRRDRVMGGGAMVIDSGFHFLDTVRYFYGEPEQVYADVRAFRDGEPPARHAGLAEERENTAMVLLTFANGVVGTWCWSFAVAGHETRNIVINGSEGSIEDTGYSSRYVVFHQFMGPGELRRRDGTYLSIEELQARHRLAIGPEGVQRLYPNGVTDHFAIEIWDFLDAIANNRSAEVDGWNGLATLALVESIYESAWTGRAIRPADLLSGATPSLWQQDIDEFWDRQPPPVIHRTEG